MKLIAGLGNPGQKYEKTLHNIGFQVVDLLVKELNAGKANIKFQSHFWKFIYCETAVVLLKPLTYMNLSGQAVGESMRYFKIEPHDVLIISDDLNLPPGKIRYREKGGHGGHNGLRDIIKHIGEDFSRLRIGIGKPENQDQVRNFVLSFPQNSEMNTVLSEQINMASKYAIDFILNRPVNINQQPLNA